MNEIIEFKVPIKKYWLLILFFGVTTILFGLLILIILFLMFKNSKFKFNLDYIGLLTFFSILFNYSMWFTFGYEKIIIKGDLIKIIKSNRIFSFKKSINICDIESINLYKRRSKSEQFIDIQSERIRDMQRAFPFWIKMGKIILKTKTTRKTIFNGLSEEQAFEMKNILETELNKRCTTLYKNNA